MLRNLFASNIVIDNARVALTTYLRTLKENPIRLVSMLAILFILIGVLAWWSYSVVMSLRAVTPVQSNDSSSQVQLSEPQQSPEAISDTSTTTTPPDATSDETRGGTGSNVNSSQIDVEVNGQAIPVPENGSTHQVIQNDGGKTTVDINANSSTSGSSKSSSSTDVKVRSSSSSDINIKSKEVQ
jgi:cytoskeletal protein RodZ